MVGLMERWYDEDMTILYTRYGLKITMLMLARQGCEPSPWLRDWRKHTERDQHRISLFLFVRAAPHAV